MLIEKRWNIQKEGDGCWLKGDILSEELFSFQISNLAHLASSVKKREETQFTSDADLISKGSEFLILNLEKAGERKK